MAPNNIKHIPERFLTDIRSIIEYGRQTAYAVAGQAAVMTYWNVGQRIVEEEQNGKARAEYGKQIIPLLAEQLTKDYGTEYGRRNLAYYRQFYLSFPPKGDFARLRAKSYMDTYTTHPIGVKRLNSRNSYRKII